MNTRLSLLLFVFVIIGLSACNKTDDTVATTLTTKLNLINASPDTVNFYLNGTRLSKSNVYPAGSSGYFDVAFGEQNYQVKDIFDPTGSTVRALFSKTLTLDTGKKYSFFIVDETADNAFLTNDTLQTDTNKNECYVRFVNASPDAGALDFAVGDTAKFSNVAFKTASEFKSVGVSSLKPIYLYHTGSSTPILTGNVNILAGKSYTFYAKGKLTGTGNSVLSVGTTLNFN
ncbi:MAG TPA: DUF4397 domain-containing protein [Mucilaginibacter sp.]|nr:DUF4397 domain-containing protein [Mucilaginibacter sp.]